MASNSPKVSILFLGSNPKDKQHLELTDEFNALERELDHRFELRSRWGEPATTLPDLLRKYAPQVLHFSGHGKDGNGLLFEDADGNAVAPSAAALAKAFANYTDTIRCVVLNACYTEVLALRIAMHIDIVIGMSGAIKDTTAHNFTKAFYSTLGSGCSLGEAFKEAKLKLELANDDCHVLQLHSGARVDPHQVFVLQEIPAVETEPTTPEEIAAEGAIVSTLTRRNDQSDVTVQGRITLEEFRARKPTFGILASFGALVFGVLGIGYTIGYKMSEMTNDEDVASERSKKASTPAQKIGSNLRRQEPSDRRAPGQAPAEPVDEEKPGEYRFLDGDPWEDGPLTVADGTLLASPAPLVAKIASAPELRKGKVADPYIGLRVKWDGYLSDIKLSDNNLVTLEIRRNDHVDGTVVRFEVQQSSYPSIEYLELGNIVEVEGTIMEVDTSWQVGVVQIDATSISFSVTVDD